MVAAPPAGLIPAGGYGTEVPPIPSRGCETRGRGPPESRGDKRPACRPPSASERLDWLAALSGAEGPHLATTWEGEAPAEPSSTVGGEEEREAPPAADAEEAEDGGPEG